MRRQLSLPLSSHADKPANQHAPPTRAFSPPLTAATASLVPYAIAAELLADILPIAAGVNATTVRTVAIPFPSRHGSGEIADSPTARRRTTCEIRSGSCPCFVVGGRKPRSTVAPQRRAHKIGRRCQSRRDASWLALMAAMSWTERKSNFEIVVGRSMPEDRPARLVSHHHANCRARPVCKRRRPI